MNMFKFISRNTYNEYLYHSKNHRIRRNEGRCVFLFLDESSGHPNMRGAYSWYFLFTIEFKPMNIITTLLYYTVLRNLVLGKDVFVW